MISPRILTRLLVYRIAPVSDRQIQRQRDPYGRRWALVAIFGLLMLTGNAAFGVIETYEFSDPQLEIRYHKLSQELRCPKCQNQNIADSNAPISRDLRALLHAQLESGATDEEVLNFMVDRYGEFVRYRPSVDKNTALLWYAPVILIILAFAGLIWRLRGRSDGQVDQGPSPEERQQLRAQLRNQSFSKDSK